jgi:hypothetical protein
MHFQWSEEGSPFRESGAEERLFLLGAADGTGYQTGVHSTPKPRSGGRWREHAFFAIAKMSLRET